MVEERDASAEQRRLTEVNAGIYAFDASTLRAALLEVGTANAQGEKYLPDVVAVVRAGGGTVRAHLVTDTWQTEGVNDRVQLARLGAELNRRVVEGWMRAGVTVVDPATTWIDVDAPAWASMSRSTRTPRSSARRRSATTSPSGRTPP